MTCGNATNGLGEPVRVRRLRHGEESAHFNMLDLCFGIWVSEREWRGKYVLHPDFDVSENVVVVEQHGEWAGGGSAWFREALLRDNRKITVYSAGDLYVHPNHRGKGIYSIAMQSLNRLAATKGAVLGLAFPSVYRLPGVALPKYGFAEVFCPTTHILVFNPTNFFKFLIARAKEALIPDRFNGITLVLTVSFNTPEGKQTISRHLRFESGQISEASSTDDLERVDLRIKTECVILLRIVSCFYRDRKRLPVLVLASVLKGRLVVHFSMGFLKAVLGL